MDLPPPHRALITGITGQAGYYLARYLAPAGWDLHGLVRPASREAAAALLAGLDVTLHDGDITDGPAIAEVVQAVGPERVFHFAADVSVAASWEDPVGTADVNALGVARVLHAVRRHAPQARLYYASSSEMFGRTSSGRDVLREDSALHPATPYGVAKAFGYQLIRAFRERDGMFAVSGIAGNHESPVGDRPQVVQYVAGEMLRIAAGARPPVLEIGNLEAARDWGFTGEYVEAMVAMLEAAEPRDYVIATGETRTVRDLVEAAAAVAGIPVPELRVRQERVRLNEVDRIEADPSRIARDLGWRATHRLEDLLRVMMTDPGFRERVLR